jgi:hypothetical protein
MFLFLYCVIYICVCVFVYLFLFRVFFTNVTSIVFVVLWDWPCFLLDPLRLDPALSGRWVGDVGIGGLFSPLTGKYGDLMVINGYGWLVWNMNGWIDFPFSWECHNPNWLSYFSEGWVNHQPVIFEYLWCGTLPLVGSIGKNLTPWHGANMGFASAHETASREYGPMWTKIAGFAMWIPWIKSCHPLSHNARQVWGHLAALVLTELTSHYTKEWTLVNHQEYPQMISIYWSMV